MMDQRMRAALRIILNVDSILLLLYVPLSS
jgi:hypothetical protein